MSATILSLWMVSYKNNDQNKNDNNKSNDGNNDNVSNHPFFIDGELHYTMLLISWFLFEKMLVTFWYFGIL